LKLGRHRHHKQGLGGVRQWSGPGGQSHKLHNFFEGERLGGFGKSNLAMEMRNEIMKKLGERGRGEKRVLSHQGMGAKKLLR
jgi:hypothetical protein